MVTKKVANIGYYIRTVSPSGNNCKWSKSATGEKGDAVLFLLVDGILDG